jgi:hypothetical protein
MSKNVRCHACKVNVDFFLFSQMMDRSLPLDLQTVILAVPLAIKVAGKKNSSKHYIRTIFDAF